MAARARNSHTRVSNDAYVYHTLNAWLVHAVQANGTICSAFVVSIRPRQHRCPRLDEHTTLAAAVVVIVCTILFYRRHVK